MSTLPAKRREMEAALSQFRQSLAKQRRGTAANPGSSVAQIEQRTGGATGAFDRIERQTGPRRGPAPADG